MSLSHLNTPLDVTVGQSTAAGIKSRNEDAIGIRIPSQSLLANKGVVSVIADGVSASEAGKEASETAVSSFLSDYYSTHDAWSVQTSGSKVLTALNRWLYSQGQGFGSEEKGYITTFSALILKSASAYILHVGDSRIYRLRDGELQQITIDHATPVGNGKRYLSRALGIDPKLDVDFARNAIQAGDVFLLTTDGIHDFLSDQTLQSLLNNADITSEKHSHFDGVCESIIEQALAASSDDNLSVQLLRVNSTGTAERDDIRQQVNSLPFPPPLSVGQQLDDWVVLKELHATARSEVYLVEHAETQQKAVLKTLSPNFSDDHGAIERFLLEEWIGSRITSAHVVKVIRPKNRRFLYYLTEYVEGPTLKQLIQERTRLPVTDARSIVTQVASGLRAFHRRDSLHQDIKPDNIIYTDTGIKIIDFGSTQVAGIQEQANKVDDEQFLGTLDYSAPEYHLGAPASAQSDQFSLAVLAYELMTGQLPYGEGYQRCGNVKEFENLTYKPSFDHNPLVPPWMDAAIQKALSINPDQRYEAFSEFTQDLNKPNPQLKAISKGPLFERDPLLAWRLLSGVLLASNLVLLWLLLAN